MLIHPLDLNIINLKIMLYAHLNKTLPESLRSKFLCIHSKANEIKVPFHEVQDHLFKGNLSVLRGYIVLPLCLYDAFPQVLKTSALWWRSTDVNNSINLVVNIRFKVSLFHTHCNLLLICLLLHLAAFQEAL